jgi:hypothetical protein
LTAARARILSLSAGLAASACAASARAGDPFEIQVYDGTADAPGVPGVELHVNEWATGNREASPPEASLHGQFHATLEPSLGLFPFWEIGAYVQSAVRADDGVAGWAGVKLRSKFVTPPSFDVHWRFGLNLEVSYLPPSYDRDRWGSEIRPIVAWHDATWLFAINPILDQALAGPGASDGPSFQPAAKAACTVGPVALGIEYYATFGPVAAVLPWSREEQQIFEVVDVVALKGVEVNAGIGEGLTSASAGILFKMILGYEFDAVQRPAADPLLPEPLAARSALGRGGRW